MQMFDNGAQRSLRHERSTGMIEMYARSATGRFLPEGFHIKDHILPSTRQSLQFVPPRRFALCRAGVAQEIAAPS